MSLIKKHAVIIGAGIAGLSCAWELSRIGLESLVVEAAAFPGGHAARFCCKATDQCQKCGACLLEDLLDRVAQSPRITLMLRTTLSAAERAGDDFHLFLTQRPARIHPEKCTDCAACLEACPANGALVRSPLGGDLSINEDACLFFKGSECSLCAAACPEGAFDLQARPAEFQAIAAAIAVAAGFQAFDPSEKQRFGYGRVPGVMSALELDYLIRAGNFDLYNEGRPSPAVAFVQCVGSRDPRIGRNYCSRVCCGYAVRMARLLRHRFPAVRPTMFYMDIQSFDRDFDGRFQEIAQEVRLVRAIPAEIRRSADGRAEVIYQGPEEERITEAFDIVVLSVGMSPNPALTGLGDILGLTPNTEGFFGRDGEETITDQAGVFVAGAVQGPRSIQDSMNHAARTARSIALRLANRAAGGA